MNFQLLLLLVERKKKEKGLPIEAHKQKNINKKHTQHELSAHTYKKLNRQKKNVNRNQRRPPQKNLSMLTKQQQYQELNESTKKINIS